MYTTRATETSALYKRLLLSVIGMIYLICTLYQRLTPHKFINSATVAPFIFFSIGQFHCMICSFKQLCFIVTKIIFFTEYYKILVQIPPFVEPRAPTARHMYRDAISM